jgi:peptidoglycan/xylan/chitin deacetylase (PgdA/CDA1 family)
MHLPVIMYHRIGSGDRYCVSQRDFARQMRYLADYGYRSILPEELSVPGRTVRRIMITFDDGHESDCTAALPVLEQHGFQAVSFVTTGFIGTPGYMTWDMVRRLARAGWAVMSHTHGHLLLGNVDAAALRHELRLSRTIIETRLGCPVKALSLPGGSCSSRVLAEARAAGYRYVFGSVPALNNAGRHAPLGRVLISSGTGDETFRRIVRGDRRFYARARRAYAVRGLVKRLIGAGRYHRLWRRYWKHPRAAVCGETGRSAL